MGSEHHQHVHQAPDASNSRGSDTCLPRPVFNAPSKSGKYFPGRSINPGFREGFFTAFSLGLLQGLKFEPKYPGNFSFVVFLTGACILAIDRAYWRFASSRHGRIPRPRGQILATPRRKAPPKDLTPLCPCSQAASAALLTASSLCIAGSQSKRAMAESPWPWPGQGRWGMRGDGMRGRERERAN